MFIESFETEENIYIVMENCKGGNIGNLLKDGKVLNERKVQRIIYNVCLGLQYLHHNRIIHRDLKLENLLMSDPKSLDRVKITDFGLSVSRDPYNMIKQGAGTSYFIAPEVL